LPFSDLIEPAFEITGEPRHHDVRQNAEARKMPNRNLKTYRKILEDRRLAMSSGSCDSALFFDVRQLPL
jgi:hypothetical protein